MYFVLEILHKSFYTFISKVCLLPLGTVYLCFLQEKSQIGSVGICRPPAYCLHVCLKVDGQGGRAGAFMGSERVGHDWATELNWLKGRFEFLKWQESISSSHFLSSWTANLKPMILFHFYQNQSPSFSASWHILILFVNTLKQRAVKTWLIFLYSQLSYTESSDSPRETASHKLKVKLFPFSHQPLTLPVQYINIIFKMHVCSF